MISDGASLLALQMCLGAKVACTHCTVACTCVGSEGSMCRHMRRFGQLTAAPDVPSLGYPPQSCPSLHNTPSRWHALAPQTAAPTLPYNINNSSTASNLL